MQPDKAAAYHHGDLRRALLDAALATAVESGSTRDVTVREAARRAGVSHNAPYRHFPDRIAILTALAEEGFALLKDQLLAARAGEQTPEGRFVETGLGYLRFAQEKPGYLIVMYGPDIEKSQTELLKKRANEVFQVLKLLAADAGVEDEHEARKLGVIAWSFVYGLARLTARNQVPPSVRMKPEALARQGLHHLFRSFQTQRA